MPGSIPITACSAGATINRTLLLPSTVFEADDTGRSYRFRPCTDSIWLRQITIRAASSCSSWFPIGRTWPRRSRDVGDPRRSDRGRRPIRGACAAPSPTSTHRCAGSSSATRSCKGMFIGDDETPPECLRRDLENRAQDQGLDPQHGPSGLLARAILLLAVAFADRFRPHFVVVSVFANDFGDDVSASRSRAREIGTRASTGWTRSLSSAGRGLDRTWSCRFLMSRRCSAGGKSRLLPRHDLQHPGGQQPDVPRPRATTCSTPTWSWSSQAERVGSRGLMAARSSTSRSATGTSRPGLESLGPDGGPAAHPASGLEQEVNPARSFDVRKRLDRMILSARNRGQAVLRVRSRRFRPRRGKWRQRVFAFRRTGASGSTARSRW